MIPIFVQTDRHVIDVAKITNMVLKRGKNVTATVYFGDHFVELAHADTDQLISAMATLACQRPPALIAHRAREAA